MSSYTLYPLFENETDLEPTKLVVGDIIAYDPTRGVFRVERNGAPLWFEIPREEERYQYFRPPWMYSTSDAAALIIARGSNLSSRCIPHGYTPPEGFSATEAWSVDDPRV